MVGTKIKKLKLRENAGGWKGQTVWGARDSEYYSVVICLEENVCQGLN